MRRKVRFEQAIQILQKNTGKSGTHKTLTDRLDICSYIQEMWHAEKDWCPVAAQGNVKGARGDTSARASFAETSAFAVFLGGSIQQLGRWRKPAAKKKYKYRPF